MGIYGNPEKGVVMYVDLYAFDDFSVPGVGNIRVNKPGARTAPEDLGVGIHYLIGNLNAGGSSKVNSWYAAANDAL